MARAAKAHGSVMPGAARRIYLSLALLLIGFASNAVALIDMPPRSASAQPIPARVDDRVSIDDEVVTFVRFYSKATSSPLSADERWALWKKDYGLAAVPPTPFGKTLARKQLDAVWERYATLIPKLPALTERARSLAAPTLRAIAELFGDDDEALAINLTLFVGQFDNNAFAGPLRHDVPTVYLPVEMTDVDVALAHEFAHAVHKHVGHLTKGYVAPIGETLLMEGIAMRAAQQVSPGHGMTAYTPATVYGSEWIETCESNADAILRGIAPYLDSGDAEITTRFTYGKGTTGLHDELYCAGWVLVEQLLTDGYSYRTLVRLPEAELPAFVSRAITDRLGPRHSALKLANLLHADLLTLLGETEIPGFGAVEGPDGWTTVYTVDFVRQLAAATGIDWQVLLAGIAAG